MGHSDDEANEAIRLSWCHLTPEVEWEAGLLIRLQAEYDLSKAAADKGPPDPV